jgi:hypothetical protein
VSDQNASQRMDADRIDDEAAAALYSIRNAPLEHMGLLYQHGGNLNRTATQSRNKRGQVKGAFSIPAGSLQSLFHNHPRGADMKNSPATMKFSDVDVAEAERLNVPSYIASGERMRRYDPATNQSSDVLAQFPWEEAKRKMMIEILSRDPNDPRGLER